MVRLILASRGRITWPFGAKNPAGSGVATHQGVDTGHGNGLDIFAPASGVATAHDAGTRIGSYGKYWRIVHDDGTVSLIAHLARHTGSNRRVAQGEVIGVMGNTGTNDVHCHQEYLVNGTPVDPTLYLTAPAGGDTTPIEDHPATKVRKRAMTRFVVRFIDVNNYYVFDTAPHLPNVAARYSQATNMDEVARMREIMPYIEYPNQGAFDRDRIKFRLGDTATLVPSATQTAGATPDQLADKLAERLKE